MSQSLWLRVCCSAGFSSLSEASIKASARAGVQSEAWGPSALLTQLVAELIFLRL